MGYTGCVKKKGSPQIFIVTPVFLDWFKKKFICIFSHLLSMLCEKILYLTLLFFTQINFKFGEPDFMVNIASQERIKKGNPKLLIVTPFILNRIS